jgi:hypothetical protein
VSAAYSGNHGVNIMGSRQLNPALYYPGATVAKENANRSYSDLRAVEFELLFLLETRFPPWRLNHFREDGKSENSSSQTLKHFGLHFSTPRI